jgi:DNA polymerase-3 subunit gamma/tau
VQAQPDDSTARARLPDDYRALVNLFEEQREINLRNHLYHHVHLVNYQPGLLELRVGDKVPSNFVPDVMRKLQEWTGRRWMVSLSQDEGALTLAKQDSDDKKSRWENAQTHPLVAATLKQFPGAKLIDVRKKPVNEAEAEVTETEIFEEEVKSE